MPIFFRAIAALNTAREWFSFTGEAVSFFGLAKRAAAATTAVAVLAGAGVGAVKTVEAVSQSPQERAIKAAIATHAPGITPDIRELVMKVKTENLYSELFLMGPQNAALLQPILAICQAGNALPHEQCNIAVQAQRRLDIRERDAARRAARARAMAEPKGNSTLRMPWQHTLVK